jgi:hypothetical protein
MPLGSRALTTPETVRRAGSIAARFGFRLDNPRGGMPHARDPRAHPAEPCAIVGPPLRQTRSHTASASALASFGTRTARCAACIAKRAPIRYKGLSGQQPATSFSSPRPPEDAMSPLNVTAR